ncbi:hypothetical protein NB706_003442 [Xanthomonas sacchari]|nr:hypothetical protein [Xanthomonas sacchari]
MVARNEALRRAVPATGPEHRDAGQARRAGGVFRAGAAGRRGLGDLAAQRRQTAAHRQHPRTARVDRTGKRPARLAGGRQLRPRRRSGRNPDPAARRSGGNPRPRTPARLDRGAPAAGGRAGRRRAPCRGGGRLAQPGLRRAPAVQQAADRRIARGRVAATGAAGAGGDVRDRHCAYCTAHARRLVADAAGAGAVAVRRGAAQRPPAALPVLPRLAAGSRSRHARRSRRLAAGVEMGRHPPAADPPRRRSGAVVAWRGTPGRALPGDRGGRGDAAARCGDRWRAAGLARRRARAAAVHRTADPHPATQAWCQDPGRYAGAGARL